MLKQPTQCETDLNVWRGDSSEREGHSSSWGGGKQLLGFWHHPGTQSPLYASTQTWGMVLACLFFCLTSKAKFNITSSNSKNIHNQQPAEFVCDSSCRGGLRAFTNTSDLMTHKMPKVEWYQLQCVFFHTCNKELVQSCWKMTSCTHLRKHDPQNN